MSSSKGISIMTWNIYFGAVLTPAIGTTPEELPFRVSEIYRQFQATNFPVRAGAIANQIARKKPDLIGLQEAAIWRLLIPPNNRIAVEFDFVSILLKELSNRGLHYQALVINDNTDLTVPSSTGFNVQFIDRNVILVRKKSELKFSNIQSDNFDASITVEAGGQPFTILSGWASVDIKANGKKFRLVNTHLQPGVIPVQVAQVNELLQGPGATDLPLVFIGDFNSNANGGGESYNILIDAGFVDSWTIAGQGAGLTCCQDPDLLNLISQLVVRIDLILFRGDFKVNHAEVVGEEQKDRTPTALWPSDHAGVAASLTLKC